VVLPFPPMMVPLYLIPEATVGLGKAGLRTGPSVILLFEASRPSPAHGEYYSWVPSHRIPLKKALRAEVKVPIMAMKEYNMAVSPKDVEKVLRTYGRRLRRSQQLLKEGAPRAAEAADSVNLSARTKSHHVVEPSTAETDQDKGRRECSDEVEREAINRLSLEYGEPLHVVSAGDGQIQLGVVDAGAGNVRHLLSPKESERLTARLHQITMEIMRHTLRENRDES
jgi:hypothetical protein